MDAALEARIVIFNKMMPPAGTNLSADSFNAGVGRMRARLEQMPEPSFGESIPDRDFLEAIDRLTPERTDESFGSLWTTFFELKDVFGLPDELLRAKAKDMFERQLIYGCDCGCRGDISLDCDGSLERPTIDRLLDAEAGRYDPGSYGMSFVQSPHRTLASLEDTVVEALSAPIPLSQAWLTLANRLGPKRRRTLALPAFARRGPDGHFYMVEKTVLPSLTTKRGFFKRG
jgi:hypothetical protein